MILINKVIFLFTSRLCYLQLDQFHWCLDRKKNCYIGGVGDVQDPVIRNSHQTALASLRNKIRRHEMSRAHEIAQELNEKGGQDVLGNLVRAVSDTVLAETNAVFRTAYYLAKMNRPFSDHDDLIELQEKNGVNMGTSLHSRYSSTIIVEHIAKKMQTKLVDSIVSSSGKLSVLID